MALTFLAPARWPAAPGKRRLFAQRWLPSMTMARCRGLTLSVAGGAPAGTSFKLGATLEMAAFGMARYPL